MDQMEYPRFPSNVDIPHQELCNRAVPETEKLPNAYCKKYEVVADQFQSKQEYQLKLKNQALMDELGIQKHFREKKET